MSVIDDIKNRKETIWINPGLEAVGPRFELKGQKFVKVKAAQARLLRFMPYIERVFPETESRRGIIESQLIEAKALKERYKAAGRLFIKDDAHLPVSGSVKARGGIHEVLAFAEKIAMKEKLIKPGDDYAIFDTPLMRERLSKYKVQVGSTGNLGLSIGIMGASLGFEVIVHMSREASEWKKELLRGIGVRVIEYEGDYTSAVAAGRKQSEDDPYSYFVDDERSEDLFFGYATAALRLKMQLAKQGISVDGRHPLLVFIPCGVGGAPGGITFGLKQVFGENVHCFFAEPVEAACFTLGMASGDKSSISVTDVGLSGQTVADGLAVVRPSEFVCEMMQSLVSGSFTVADEKLIEYMKYIYSSENLFLEPSACAGVRAVEELFEAPEFKTYLNTYHISEVLEESTSIVWATGGGMIPESVRKQFLS